MPVLCMPQLPWESVGAELSTAHHETLHSATPAGNARLKARTFVKSWRLLLAVKAVLITPLALQECVHVSETLLGPEHMCKCPLNQFHKYLIQRAVHFSLLLSAPVTRTAFMLYQRWVFHIMKTIPDF